jgi:succinate-semialdehyde dehydrogenase / glutarate-semialdehyde dehydrogenase
MKLADPSLLKDRRLVDGKRVGEGTRPIANPATGAVLAKTPRFGRPWIARKQYAG